jgi:hypothetical protein
MTKASHLAFILLSTSLLGCIDDESVDDDEVVVGEGEVESAVVVNTSADYLVVYNNNIENMAGCGGTDWNKLFKYVKAQSKSPDIFTIQQISNQTQLNALVTRMTNELPGTYGAVIAIKSPGSMGYDDGCAAKKDQQTNAVIFRTDRFTQEDVTTWRSDAPDNWNKGTGGCKNLDDTPTSQDRVQNVAVRLYDKVAKQRVTVASIHWPTNTWHGPLCAAENMKEANSAVDSLGGTLKIVAGDANTTKGTKGWWNDARDLGFRDPIAETCPSSGCPDSTSTSGTHRIDYMLVKSGHGFGSARTINESSTGGKYSDHRALRANVYY